MKLVSKQLNVGTRYQRLAAGLQKALNTKGGAFVTTGQARGAWGLESLDAGAIPDHESAVETVQSVLQDEVGGEEALHEEYTEGQIASATIAMMATGDPVAYATKARESVTGSDYQLDAGTTDVAVSTESYDASEIKNMMPVSIAYNLGAARQDEAMEALWPTIALTADQAGLELTVARTMVHYYWTHKYKGAATTNTAFNQRSLIDAFIDTSILRNQAIDLIPLYETDTGIFDTEVGVIPRTQDDNVIDSGAILFNKRFDLIGAGASSQTDPFAQRDHTDTLDGLVRLKTVYVEIEDQAGTKSVVPLDVLDYNGTAFTKTSEGDSRDVGLSWSSYTYAIDGNLKDKTGNPAPALEAMRQGTFAKRVLHLRIGASGTLNLADGHGELMAGTVSIDRVFEEQTLPDGTKDLIELKDPTEVNATKALVKSMTLRSFVLDARYANVNRRERGTFVRIDTKSRRYGVMMQSPVTVMKPVVEVPTQFTIDAAVNTTRAGNSVAGVLELMEVDKRLANYRSPRQRISENSDVPGIGAFVLRPYYERKPLDLTKMINNNQSANLALDISEHLMLFLRDSFAKAMMYSGWYAAQRCQGGNSKEKPTAVIITDQRIAQLIFTRGDTRVMGDRFNAMVEVSDYTEFTNKIFMTVRRESSVQAPDGLSFGNMFWLPELVTNVTATRNGQISDEFTVNPRRRHVNHCPILMHYDILNIDKVIDTKVTRSVVNP